MEKKIFFVCSRSKMLPFLYIASVFSYGFSFGVGGFQLYRVLLFSLFLYVVTLFSVRAKIPKVNTLIVLFFCYILFSTLASLENFGYHQGTGYLNSIIFLVVSFGIWRIVNYRELIGVYLEFCFLFSLVAISQQALYIAGSDLSFFKAFLTLNNVTEAGGFLRVFSLTREPSHFAILLIPSVFIIISSFFFRSDEVKISKGKVVAILAAYVMTFSLVAYAYIFAFIGVSLLLMEGRRYIKCLVVVIILPVMLGLLQIEEIWDKARSIDSIFVVNDSVNSSAFALQSNLMVAYSVIDKSPYTGNGPFTHMDSYYENIGDIYNVDEGYRFLNTRGAASLYIRTLSELGLIGFSFFIALMIFGFIYFRNDPLAAIFLTSLFCYGLRMGNLDHPMFWFILSFVNYRSFFHRGRRRSKKIEWKTA